VLLLPLMYLSIAVVCLPLYTCLSHTHMHTLTLSLSLPLPLHPYLSIPLALPPLPVPRPLPLPLHPFISIPLAPALSLPSASHRPLYRRHLRSTATPPLDPPRAQEAVGRAAGGGAAPGAKGVAAGRERTRRSSCPQRRAAPMFGSSALRDARLLRVAAKISLRTSGAVSRISTSCFFEKGLHGGVVEF